VLGYIDQLKEVDVRDVAPLENMNEAFSLSESTPLRADLVQPSVPVEAALKNAPKSADRYFLVPKVLATEVKAARPIAGVQNGDFEDEEEMF
jgi:aspartyl-tRNA(Asn)/glutamyl-tRNA(Gln) amidotransferase subunit C